MTPEETNLFFAFVGILACCIIAAFFLARHVVRKNRPTKPAGRHARPSLVTGTASLHK
jgi:hypothetical protein